MVHLDGHNHVSHGSRQLPIGRQLFVFVSGSEFWQLDQLRWELRSLRPKLGPPTCQSRHIVSLERKVKLEM